MSERSRENGIWRVAADRGACAADPLASEEPTPVSGEHGRVFTEQSGEFERAAARIGSRPSFPSRPDASEPDIVVRHPGPLPTVRPLVVLDADAERASAALDTLRPTASEPAERKLDITLPPPAARPRVALLISAAAIVAALGTATVMASMKAFVPRASAAASAPPAQPSPSFDALAPSVATAAGE